MPLAALPRPIPIFRRTPRPLAAVLTALALLCPIAAVAAPATPGEWTPDDFIRAERSGGWTLSPDGAFAAWVRTGVETVEKQETRVSNLWLTRFAEAVSLPFTRGASRVSDPAFSPDGKHVAFLSDRKLPPGENPEDPGKTQLWAIPVAGGEAFPVTRLERDVIAFGWLDGKTLLLAAKESPGLWEIERKKAKDDSEAVEDAEHEAPVRLFRVSLEGGDIRRLTDNRDWIDLLQVSPDGRSAVVRAQQSLSYEYDAKVPPRVFLVDTRTGAMRRLFEDGRLQPEEVRWSPDSKGLFFTHRYSHFPQNREAAVQQLWHLDAATGKTERADAGWERGVGGAFVPVPGGALALLADGVRYRLSRLTRGDGVWRREDLTGPHVRNILDLAASRDGTVVAYEYSTPTVPTQWYAARLEGAGLDNERKLTDLNRGFEGKPTGRVEVVRWKGARDEEVEGLLHYPLNWKEGARYPLILDIHGGPAGTDLDAWSPHWISPNLLWRQKGAFVFQVNYHGSAGYGLEWLESIGNGHYYELEIPDIERGVDEMIRRGLIDPERLAVTGWSNGGILAIELITRTRRYRAASIGAADVEWISDYGNVDFGATFDNFYLGGPPWQKAQLYVEKSPLFRLPEVTTPSIVFTGTADTNVPPGQSRSLFRALQQIGRAPVRLVLFPDEPHVPKVVAHQRRKMAEEAAWFDRYFFGAPPAKSEALKDGSLLAGLLAKSKASRVEGALGRTEAGMLVPETVAFCGLEVGRFEVTRAQWKAYDPAFPLKPGEEDLPVTGIPFGHAAAYASWLAQKTGRPYRLPTVEESKRLAEDAGREGNTLDRWAGYAPNPEDRAGLLKEIEGLGAAPLILPVGSFAGSGKEPVFDLDGNAAEWAVDEKGGGKAAGPSADLPADTGTEAAPGGYYTGLRVVVGPASK